MSFSSTPLGQGRRLDHHTFLNNKAPNPAAHARAPNEPPRADRIPASYAYGCVTPPFRPRRVSSSHPPFNPAHPRSPHVLRQITPPVIHARKTQRTARTTPRSSASLALNSANRPSGLPIPHLEPFPTPPTPPGGPSRTPLYRSRAPSTRPPRPPPPKK